MKTIKTFGLAILSAAIVFGTSLTAFAASDPYIVNLRHSSVTQSSAVVEFNTKNPSKLAVTNCGLQIRKAGGKWTTKTDNVAAKWQRYGTLNSSYQIGKGREVNITLAAGTKYEYRGYCKANGKITYSGVSSFTTPKAAASSASAPVSTPKATSAANINAPVNLGAGRWFALTYPGHGASCGDSAKVQYYATDWNLPGNADRGQNVYAMANGVVENVYPSSGSIMIRYTEPMQLTNGVVFKGDHWRSWYGHMNTINVQAGQKVSRGQAIGTIGKRSASTEHLHMSIFGDFNGQALSGYTNATQKSMAISPYWIKGLNNANLYCDDANGTREPAGLYESTILNTNAMPR